MRVHVCMLVPVPKYMYAYHVHAGNLRGKKRTSDLWELELQAAMSYHVGAEN